MNRLIAVILVPAIMGGCAPKQIVAKRQTWEYKIVEADNRIKDSSKLGDASSPDWMKNYRARKSDAGNFSLAGDDVGYQYAGAELNKLGADGWELVGIAPEAETVPDAEYFAGPDYGRMESGKPADIYKPFVNMRTGKMILVFKRPSE